MFNNITRRLHALEHQQSMVILDQYQNAVYIIGPLNQTVTIGAGFTSLFFSDALPVAGVHVTTGLSGVGVAYPSGFADTTGTTTLGSTSMTVASASGLSW